MSKNASFTEFTSRPKIHRLPAPVMVSGAGEWKTRAIWGAGAALALLAGFSLYSPQKPARESTAQPIIAAERTELSSSTIYIQDKEGTIVGQMAKIPPESEKITDIKNVSDIDRPAGRDLLAIISKY